MADERIEEAGRRPALPKITSVQSKESGYSTAPTAVPSSRSSTASSSPSSQSSSPGAGTDCSGYELAAAVVEEAVGEAGETWWDAPDCPDTPPAYFASLRRLCREFRRRAAQSPDAYLHRIADLPLQPADLHDTFLAVVAQVTVAEGGSERRVHWGRLVGICAVVSSLAGECARRGFREGPGDLAAFLGTYLDGELSRWVLANGGWEALPAWEHSRSSPDAKSFLPWAVGAAVLVAFASWRLAPSVPS